MSTATQAPARPRRTTDREPVDKLISVELDRDRSTPYDELWRARSDRFADVVYDVRHHVEDDSWACTCPGYLNHGHCKHVARSKRRRKVAWYHALWLGWGPQALRAERAHYLDLEASGYPLHEDDYAAIDALGLLLQWHPEEVG